MSERPGSTPPEVARPAVETAPGASPTPGELELLADLGRAISSFRDRDELLHFTLDTALALLGSESGSLYLYDPEEEELVLTIARGPEQDERLGLRQRLGEGVAGLVAIERKPILVTDIGTDRRFGRRRSRRYQSASFICAPLLVSNELVGIITITMKRTAAEFTEDELRILSILAGHAASAIESLRLLNELRELNRRLAERVARATAQLSVANEQLARLQGFNESILAAIPLGVLAFDRDLLVTYRNGVVADLAPIKVGEPLGRLMEHLAIDPARSPWHTKVQAALSDGQPVHFLSLACAEGRVMDLLANPLRDSAGRIIGGLLVLEDTTRKVATERKLAASERMASVGQLAARVAHELNNPLDGILRFLSLATRVLPADSPAVKYLEQSRSGLMRMVAIIRDLLKFSRSTVGAFEASDVNQLLTEAVASLASKAEAQRVDIVTDLAQNLPTVRAGGLFQVFYNLLTNALDAMPQGGTLTVRTVLTGDPPDRQVLEVSVRDTGTGIPPEVRDRVFEPFFTTKESGKGTGLGLAISRDIVQKYDGSLDFTTEVGQGTEFRVRLPKDIRA